MAEELTIRGAEVKIRHPWGAWGLALVTLGIYGIVWWYKINRELRDYSAAKGQPLENDPTMSVLALVPGFIIIVPPFWTNWTTPTRVAAIQEMSGERNRVSALLSLVLWYFVLGTHIVYLQYALNAVWRAAREEPLVVAEANEFDA
jgi:hypothetical protein